MFQNGANPIPNLPKEASLAMHLINSFGYRQGDAIAKDQFKVLIRAHDFVSRCVQNDWIASDGDQLRTTDMRIIEWPRVKELFDQTFSTDDCNAFAKL